MGQLQSESSACSAAVITSESGQLVLTAAHCVYTPEQSTGSGQRLDFKGREPGWLDEEIRFVPGRTGDDAPHGQWQVERMWVPEEWQETGDGRFDVAVLRTAKQDGKTIQDAVGHRASSSRWATRQR